METGIILESAVPVRGEPSDKSEMVNQLLFGEQYKVLLNEEKWLKVKSIHDDYEGWIDRKQHYALSESQINASIVYDDALIIQKEGQIRLSPGSLLPKEDFLYKLGWTCGSSKTDNVDSIKEHSLKFLNAPYLWGGRTVYGIDCSGFTQLVYRMMGHSIPRDASEQVELGKDVSFIEEAKEGDLVFFDNKDGRITHVGVVLQEGNEKKIIHASGRVRIDKLDHQGIFNENTQSYSHQLRTIKTII